MNSLDLQRAINLMKLFNSEINRIQHKLDTLQ